MLDGPSLRTTEFTLDVATAAIKGARAHQEDSMLASFPVGQGAGFAIIADGIGGHVAGNVASALVTTEVFSHLKMQEAGIVDGSLDIGFALRAAAQRANTSVSEHMAKHEETQGMGTTLLVPVVQGNCLSWLSIGDSPLYLFRDGELRQLNQDHSLAPQIDLMVRAGAMSEENGRNHPDRGTLTSVVTGSDIAEIDCPTAPLLLHDGDIVIASSDGVQSLSTDDITAALSESDKSSSLAVVNTLLAEIATLADPEQDNTAFVVMIARGNGTVEMPATQSTPRPVLRNAGDTSIPPPKPSPVTAPKAEPVKDESKVYYYRGQKYYRD